MRFVSLTILLWTGGCTLVTNFEPGRANEASDARCADGIDNDGNGLTDCQDWSCLDFKACCTLDRVVFEDSFGGPACAAASCAAPVAGCNAIDPALWQPWGLPLPVVCENGLAPHKSEQCYDVGVLGRTPVALHPGLKVRVHVIGRPEPAAHLEVGLTLQPQIASGATNCSPALGVKPAVSLRQVWTPSGSQIIAHLLDEELGRSPEITDDQPHLLSLDVDPDLSVAYSLDGTRFVTSVAEGLPNSAPSAYLYLSGIGLAARFDDASVLDGTRCEAPAAFVPASPLVTLEGTGPNGQGFEAYQVYSPSVQAGPDGVKLYYGACGAGTLDHCDSTVAFGRATESPNGLFERDPQNPVVRDLLHFPARLSILRDDAGPDVHGFLSVSFFTKTEQVLYEFTAPGGGVFDDVFDAPLIVAQGSPGAWDDSEVCCGSALVRDGQVLLWYAGRSQRDPTWRVGLARSSDNVTFVKDLHNPVLLEGVRDAFDARGATDPEVIYDPGRGLYRMWYQARALLGQTTVGYAISTDGVAWSKFPGNPVITPADFGLETVASPAVLVEPFRLRMWLVGTELTHPALRIYGLENTGHAPE